MGHMTPEVLAWLRQDVQDLPWLRKQFGVKACLKEEGLKTVLSGKTVDEPGSFHLNGLEIKHPLPMPHLLGWLRAFKHLNALSVARLGANAQAVVKRFGAEQDIKQNGEHMIDTPVTTWCLAAGQVHVFKKPHLLEEAQHYDGGASLLHMGITLYGRRVLRSFEQDKGGEFFDLSLSPGSVYLGTLTGHRHQVLHRLPRAEAEAKDTHSITVMVRTTLFPAPRAHCMARMPNPVPMFLALAASFVQSINEEPWRLPSLEECENMVASANPYLDANF